MKITVRFLFLLMFLFSLVGGLAYDSGRIGFTFGCGVCVFLIAWVLNLDYLDGGKKFQNVDEHVAEEKSGGYAICRASRP